VGGRVGGRVGVAVAEVWRRAAPEPRSLV